MTTSTSSLPRRVRLVEVGPRDGLQNEKAMVPTDVKVALIDRLADAGLPAIEATSFVSPKWVPQMADAADVMARIRRRPGVGYPVLMPNMKGFEARAGGEGRRGRRLRRGERSVLAAEHQLLIAESLERFRPVVAAAIERRHARARLHLLRARLSVRGRGDAGARGRWSPRAVARIGVETSRRRHDRRRHARADAARAGGGAAPSYPLDDVGGHFHDTYGQALANIYAAWKSASRRSTARSAGLGGCPYAKGATGNVATEDVVYLLDGLGIETGVDLAKLRAAGRFISDVLGRPTGVARRARARRRGAPEVAA